MSVKTALLSIQTILIALLIVKVFSMDSKLSFYAENSISTAESMQSLSSMPPQKTKSAFEPPVIDINEIRRVVREEFNRLLDKNNPNLLIAPSKEFSAHQIDRNPIRLEQVNQKVESLILMGTLATRDLEVIYADISQLEVNDQKEVLKRLTQAVNSGELVLIN